MLIEILGSGCARCRMLEDRTREAMGPLGITAEVTHVTDPVAIAGAGVMRTPALAIDGEVVVSGRVPTVAALGDILRRRGGLPSTP